MSEQSEYSNYEGNWNNPISQDRPANFMNISDSIAQRLQTGAVDDERWKNHDRNWIEKLAEIDREHTIQKNIDITEIDRSMKYLDAYSSGGTITTCPADKMKIMDCYKKNKGGTLNCESEVKDFIQCIDGLLYKASHIDERTTVSVTCPKKMTYRQRFENSCLNK